MRKFALISLGNEESYGLLFVGEELKKHGEIRFFDAEMSNIQDIINYNPDHICFSPMTTFYNKAKNIENEIKKHIDVISIYGGHHATNIKKPLGDITVIGAIHNIDISQKGVVFGGPTLPENLTSPARKEYYKDIPRMQQRYRKIMLSVTGCPFTCTYCSSSAITAQNIYGTIKHALRHRKIEDIINEALYIKDITHEVEWVDDDIFYGDHIWLYQFFNEWIDKVGLPMYVSTTSISTLKARPDLLRLMRKVINCIGLGVQAARPESLRILGRAWDNQEQIKMAYDYLTAFGFKVNLQCIIGLPVSDPIKDALDTIDFLRKIGKGSIISCYPLQLYPNTQIIKYCIDNGFRINSLCNGDTNSGLPGIDFGYLTNNKIKNICKLATMVVKYGISRDWLEAMLDIELMGDSNKLLSQVRYFECINDRLPDKAKDIYSSVLNSMNIRY